MAKKTAGATATPGAGLAARPRGERSPVTRRDLQAYRRRLEAELAELHGQCADLARIGAGRFGRCEACGDAIEAERLDALPYTTLCLADARRRARPR